MKLLNTWLLALCISLVAVASAQEAAPELIQTNMDSMLTAVALGSYDSFIASGSPDFKVSYSAAAFALVSEAKGARLSAGYDATYLTSLNVNDYVVYLWKLSYSDGQDDSLLSISVANGFVVGFLIQ